MQCAPSARECGEHIPYASVVDLLSPDLSTAVRAMREDDGVDAVGGLRQRIGSRQVAGDDLDARNNRAALRASRARARTV
jgi:hypothetical protein